MDLSYNLGIEPSIFLGADPDKIKLHVGSAREKTYREALATARERNITFSLSPLDSYTAGVSTEIEPGLRLITAGPHTERVRSQNACSHSLAAPLKIFLPLLRLNVGEAVVIDERAGTDPVATGILASVDLAVIVREQTLNSRRVTEQIQKELELAEVPYLIIDNKVKSLEEDMKDAAEKIFGYARGVVSM